MNGHYVDEGLGFSLDFDMDSLISSAGDALKEQGQKLVDKAKDEGQKYLNKKKDEFVQQGMNKLKEQGGSFASNLMGGNQSKPSSAPRAPSSAGPTKASSLVDPTVLALARSGGGGFTSAFNKKTYNPKLLNAVANLQNTSIGRKIGALNKSLKNPATQNVVRNIGAQQTIRAFEKSNTMLYVGLGVAAVAVIGGALYFTKK